MTNQPLCSNRLRSLKVAAFATAAMFISATPALATVSVDTIAAWDGATFISSFGVTDTATYGQTISVRAGATPLTSYSFEIGNCGASVTLRGSVYAWDGTKATGPSLFTSSPQTVSASPSFQLVTINVGSLTLPAGNYVLFASTSDDQAGAPASACRWGSVNNVLYPGGQFVFLNNGANSSRWTLDTWSTIAQDLAFRVDGLYVAPANIPTLSEWGLMVLSGLMALGTFAIMRRRRF